MVGQGPLRLYVQRQSKIHKLNITILSNVSGAIDVIKDGENGFFTCPGKPKMLAENIMRLYDDKILSIEKNARQTIENEYTWNHVTKNILEFDLKKYLK